jgi:hypothetical protein
MRVVLLAAVVLGLASAGLPAVDAAQPAPALCCTLSGTFPWGDLAFAGPATLLVPQAEIRTLSPEEVERERERRRAWLQRPREEVLGELVQRAPGEPENVYQFRRWLAERYLDWMRANPEAALRVDPRRARALSLAALEVSQSGLRSISTVTLWEGDVQVSKQVTSWGGTTIETDLVNLRAGAVPGPRYVAAWAHAAPHRPVAALLDREGRSLVAGLGQLRPLVWLAEDTLLALEPADNATELVLLTVDSQGRVQQRRSAGRSPAHLSGGAAERVPDAPWAVVSEPLRGVWAVDLTTGQVQPVRDRQGELQPHAAVPVAWDRRVWVLTLSNRFWLLGLGAARTGVEVSERLELPHTPGQDPWEGPLAAGPDGLVVARDVMLRRVVGRGVTSGTSSGSVSLWWLARGSQTPRPLDLQIRYRSPSRPVAVSPDGRWLAAQVTEREVRLWRLR